MQSSIRVFCCAKENHISTIIKCPCHHRNQSCQWAAMSSSGPVMLGLSLCHSQNPKTSWHLSTCNTKMKVLEMSSYVHSKTQAQCCFHRSEWLHAEFDETWQSAEPTERWQASDARHVYFPERWQTSAAPHTSTREDRVPTSRREASGDPRREPSCSHKSHACKRAHLRVWWKTGALGSSHLSTLKSTCWFSPGATSSITSHTRRRTSRRLLISTFEYFEKPWLSHMQELRDAQGATMSLWSKNSANPA